MWPWTCHLLPPKVPHSQQKPSGQCLFYTCLLLPQLVSRHHRPLTSDLPSMGVQLCLSHDPLWCLGLFLPFISLPPPFSLHHWVPWGRDALRLPGPASKAPRTSLRPEGGWSWGQLPLKKSFPGFWPSQPLWNPKVADGYKTHFQTISLPISKWHHHEA